MSYETKRRSDESGNNDASRANPRELGEQLFAALSQEEREARLVFAVFDEQVQTDELQNGAPGEISAESLRQAAIARLLLEQSVDLETQRILQSWQIDIPPLPEFER